MGSLAAGNGFSGTTGISGAVNGAGGWLGSVNPDKVVGGSVGQTVGIQAGGQPQLANVQQGTSVADVTNAQNQAGNSLQAQQGLLSALQNQNGLGAQSNVMGQLQASNGIGTQNSAIQGLQNAAGMYGQIAQGQGPNPAQAMLNQQTGQNIAAQSALMAGQRGASANAGLMARQAGQQGGNLQQQTVGQGATMQANQQLAGLQGLVGTQQAIGGLGTTQAGMQQNQANQLAGQQIGQVNANTEAALSNQQQMQNSLAGVNQANVANQASLNAGNTALANTALQGKQGLIGGFMNAFGTGISGMADGGEVEKAVGGSSALSPVSDWGKYLTMAKPLLTANAGQSDAAIVNALGNMVNSDKKSPQPMADGGETEFESAPAASSAPSSNWSNYANQAAAAGSAGGSKEDSQDLGLMSEIGSIFAAKGGLAADGGNVKAKEPGQKAVAKGDSYSNDKIPANLSEHEIVLPRSVTLSQDPAAAAAQFVTETLAKRKTIPKENFGEGGEAAETAEAAPPMEAADTAETPAVPSPAAQPPAASPDPTPQIAQAAPAIQPGQNMPAPDPVVQDRMNAAADMATKKIEPHTLFGDKNTLGKIRTMFGLMVSGAGSGLAHQPNLLMDMMNKQLDRDLDAQKQNVETGRNFLATTANMRLQQAQAAAHNISTLNQMTQGRTAAAVQQQILNGIPPSLALEQYDERGRKVWDDAATLPFMREAVYHDLSSNAPNTPAAQQALQQMRAGINQANANDDGKRKFIEADAKTKYQNPNMAFDSRKLMSLQQSGIPLPPALDQEMKMEQDRRNKTALWSDTYNYLAGLKNAGQSPITEGIGSAGEKLTGLWSVLGGTASAAAEKAKEKFEIERDRKVKTLKMIDPSFDEKTLPTWADNEKSLAEGYKTGLQGWSSKEVHPSLDSMNTLMPGLLRPERKYKYSPVNSADKEGNETTGSGGVFNRWSSSTRAPGEKPRENWIDKEKKK